MVSLKYGKEYRMDEELLPNGKYSKKMIYIGPVFTYAETEAEHKVSRIKLLILGIVSAVLFVFGLLFYSNLSRVWFVSVPYACNAMVLYLFFESLVFFWPYRASLEREQKEKGAERFKSLGIFSLLFHFSGLTGSTVALLTYVKGTVAFDYVFLGIVVVQVMLWFLIFREANRIHLWEHENPTKKEWESK